jgi:RecA/RadA recombinase
MFEKIKSEFSIPKEKISFGLPELDLITGRGLPMNSITEVYGTAGSGKSQLCFQIAADVLKKDENAKILFICTQERFPIERLMTMLGPFSDKSYLDRVHIEYFLDSDVEYHFFRYSLFEMMKEFRYKLVIFDNIASNSRNFENIFEKSEHINSIIASFKRIFFYFEVCAIIVNQMTDIPNDLEPIKVSALGLTLENNVNMKILLEKTKHYNERKIVVKKAMFSAPSTGYFIICSEGLKGLSEDENLIESI